jgi:hypothetical protein
MLLFWSWSRSPLTNWLVLVHRSVTAGPGAGPSCAAGAALGSGLYGSGSSVPVLDSVSAWPTGSLAGAAGKSGPAEGGAASARAGGSALRLLMGYGIGTSRIAQPKHASDKPNMA